MVAARKMSSRLGLEWVISSNCQVGIFWIFWMRVSLMLGWRVVKWRVVIWFSEVVWINWVRGSISWMRVIISVGSVEGGVVREIL